jgi:hypothetical protein
VALADGMAVDAAVADARIAINIGVTPNIEWGTPVLYMRSSDGMLFNLNQSLVRARKIDDLAKKANSSDASAKPTPTEIAITAIETDKPNKVPATRKFMEWLSQELDELEPDYSKVDAQEQAADDLLVETLAKTEDLVFDFSQVAQSIAEMGAVEAAKTLYDGFSQILEGYYVSDAEIIKRGWVGIMADLRKFISHELFVSFVGFLIINKHWELLNSLLQRKFILQNKDRGITLEEPFSYITKSVQLLEGRKVRINSPYCSEHAYLLKQRHNKEPAQAASKLAKHVPFDQFIDADYFLLMWHQIKIRELSSLSRSNWKAWSLYYFYTPSRYTNDLFGSKPNRALLLEAFSAKNITELELLLANAQQTVSNVFTSHYPNRG